jgi:hypothetical protein
MYIQYVGFSVAPSSRIYNYDVLDTKEKREFTVQVQSEAFCPSGLKLQDGPDICFARLRRALEGETQESRTEGHLSIRERDIDQYRGLHYPPAARQECSVGSVTPPSQMTGVRRAGAYRVQRTL